MKATSSFAPDGTSSLPTLRAELVGTTGRWCCWPVWLGSGLLAVAAILKVDLISNFPSPENFLLGSKVLTVLAASLEIFLALWLLSGVLFRCAVLTASLVFFLFCLLSIANFLAGETDCGCFGQMKIHPALTACVDMLTATMLCRFARLAQNSGGVRVKSVGLVVAGFSVWFIWVANSLQTVQLQVDGLSSSTGIVVLEPSQWIGKPIPIARYLEVDKGIVDGSWTLLLFRFECETCREEVRRMLAGSSESTRVAFLEMPPFGVPHVTVTDNTTVKWLRLTREREWFSHVPTVIYLNDGIVTGVEPR